MLTSFFTRAVVLAAAAATAATVAAPLANAGPDGLGSAEDVINSIKGHGDKVVVTKFGSKPLNECVATSVRTDLTVFGNPRIYPNISSGPTTRTLLYRVFHVDVQC